MKSSLAIPQKYQSLVFSKSKYFIKDLFKIIRSYLDTKCILQSYKFQLPFVKHVKEIFWTFEYDDSNSFEYKDLSNITKDTTIQLQVNGIDVLDTEPCKYFENVQQNR